MNTTRITLFSMTFMIFVSIFTPPVNANGRWAQNHPGRAEVNERLVNQNRRINQERREGEIRPAQARQMHNQERQIRQEERLMARQNGGHLNRQEQRTLNQQENQLSRRIGR